MRTPRGGTEQREGLRGERGKGGVENPERPNGAAGGGAGGEGERVNGGKVLEGRKVGVGVGG